MQLIISFNILFFAYAANSESHSTTTPAPEFGYLRPLSVKANCHDHSTWSFDPVPTNSLKEAGFGDLVHEYLPFAAHQLKYQGAAIPFDSAFIPPPYKSDRDIFVLLKATFRSSVPHTPTALPLEFKYRHNGLPVASFTLPVDWMNHGKEKPHLRSPNDDVTEADVRGVVLCVPKKRGTKHGVHHSHRSEKIELNMDDYREEEASMLRNREKIANKFHDVDVVTAECGNYGQSDRRLQFNSAIKKITKIDKIYFFDEVNKYEEKIAKHIPISCRRLFSFLSKDAWQSEIDAHCNDDVMKRAHILLRCFASKAVYLPKFVAKQKFNDLTRTLHIVGWPGLQDADDIKQLRTFWQTIQNPKIDQQSGKNWRDISGTMKAISQGPNKLEKNLKKIYGKYTYNPADERCTWAISQYNNGKIKLLQSSKAGNEGRCQPIIQLPGREILRNSESAVKKENGKGKQKDTKA